jgi:hypothetical protein
MIRRLLKAKQPHRKQSRPRRGPLARRLSLQTLEERKLLAVLTNGQGDGQLLVEVNEQGAFGASLNLAVNIPNRPAQNDVTDAIFNPAGPRIPFGTTYESGIAIRLIAPGTSREFITAGTIGNTGNNLSGFFLDPSPTAAQNNLERNSRFFWPNTIQRPANADDIPTGSRLKFDLKQTLVDLEFMGGQDGTALVQEYTIQNVSGAQLDFELIRYADGDIFSTVGGGAGNTPLLDGGGERIFDIRRGVNSVWQTDQALNTAVNDPTFYEVQSSLTAVPAAGRWEVGLAGNALPNKPIGPLLANIIAGMPLANDVTPAAVDADANDARDAGANADVAIALRQEYLNVPNNGFVVFVSTTIFGHPPRGTAPAPVPQFGRVEGTKFLDSNANGTRDPGEPGVPGFIIFADLNTNGVRDAAEPFTSTDQNGMYSLNVPIGMNEIREVNQPFWTQTSPPNGFHLADIMMAGDVITDLDFGNFPEPGEISGMKFSDDNRNGSRDPGEAPFANVTIFLDQDDDGNFDPAEPNTVTNAQGAYSFVNLQPGDYVVREVIPAGFEQTIPGGDGAYRVTLNPGQTLADLDFGNVQQLGSITGLVWNDLNDDGVRQSGEPRLAGVVVYIDENQNGQYNFGERAAITNTLGEYVIDDLLPGPYVVRQIPLPGTTLSAPAAGFHQVLVFPGLPTPFVNFGNTVRFDFGDAPESYGTLLEDDGARHSIVPGFRLGQSIDAEGDGQPTPDATGDDLNGGGLGDPVHFAVGDQPRDVLLADVTGDGLLDVVTANFGSDNVSIAHGNGDGTFGPAIEFDTDANPVAVAAADFDGDGLLDLAVAHEGNAVAVLINAGAGIFLDAETFPAGGAQSDIVASDFDGDGDVDIAVSRPNTDDVVILPNVSDATLDFDPVSAANTYPVGDNPVRLKLGRINGDSLLDMVVVNRNSNNISILRNLGAGFFATAVNHSVSTATTSAAGPNDVVIADLDGDLDRDLAVANEISGNVTVMINNGFGVFPNTAKAVYPVPGSPVAITAGMFDGNPGLDLAVALQSSDSVAVLSNDGDGMFPAAAVFPTGRSPAAITSANLDGDGIDDIVTANFAADTVSVLGFSGSDEDGVTFASPFTPGGVTQITINASAPGVVNAWIDFNRNGVFDAADRILTDASVAAGNNQFFIPTPAGTAEGPTIARFRYSIQPGLGPTGAALSGEVEDYQVQVQAGPGPGPNAGWTNLANPEDVDANGRVELFDALLLVNDLRMNGIRNLPPVTNPPPPPPFLDVNSNGAVDLNDVLRVINRILQQNAADTEGEGEFDDPLDALEPTIGAIAADVCAAQ